MTAKLRISPELAIPDDVVTATSVVYGGKGMGKTNLASVLVEEATKARLRWAVLDPMGVFWGLRHSTDGTGPGIECVILGGPHGDIPIEPTSGEIVADLVIDEGVNTVIDFSRKASGEMWGKAEKVRFVTDYALRLFRRQGDLLPGNQRREPLLQILDEAARYIPQVIPSGSFDLAKCVGAWEQIGEEGRNIGLGIAFLTQRSARMNKSVSELADVMFAFRTIGPNSLAAVMDWLGEHIDKSRIKEVAAQVRELDVGQCLVVSPGWLKVEKVVKIRARETFDSSATPKPGQRARKVTGQAAKPDLGKYRERMASTIEKAKADDPKELKKTIVELNGRIRQMEKAPASSAAAKPVIDKATIDRAVTRALAEIQKRVGFEARQIRQRLARVNAALNGVPDLMDAAIANLDVALLEGGVFKNASPVEIERAIPIEAGITHIAQRPASLPRPKTPDIQPSVDGDLSGPEQKILDVLASFDAMGVKAPPANNVAAFVGYHPNAKSYSNAKGSLRTRGFISYGNGTISLTDEGRAHGRVTVEINDVQSLHDAWLKRLGGPGKKILEVVLPIYPSSIGRDELADKVGYHPNAKSYSNALGTLRSLGLVDYPERGSIAATDTLFPEALV